MSQYIRLFVACGSTQHGERGIITSPNYPNDYPIRTDCLWRIITTEGYYVRLSFSPPFDLENITNCRYDYLKVSATVQRMLLF